VGDFTGKVQRRRVRRPAVVTWAARGEPRGSTTLDKAQSELMELARTGANTSLVAYECSSFGLDPRRDEISGRFQWP